MGAIEDRASNARPAVRHLIQWQITVIIDESMAIGTSRPCTFDLFHYSPPLRNASNPTLTPYILPNLPPSRPGYKNLQFSGNDWSCGCLRSRPQRHVVIVGKVDRAFGTNGYAVRGGVSIELWAYNAPNGRKISVALEELGLPYRVRVVTSPKENSMRLNFCGSVRTTEYLPLLIRTDQTSYRLPYRVWCHLDVSRFKDWPLLAY
jgi:hypothetical protein